MKEYPDWADFPYFLAIAKNGTLRAAAQQLGSTHATVSRHLENLETAYGVRLFDRSVDGLALTLAGHELLPLAQTAEVSVLSARRKLMGLDREAAGKVCISVPPVLAYNVLPPIFAAFIALYPKIDVEIIVTSKFQDINRGETDISVRVAHEVSDNVLGRKVIQYWAGIYASKTYIRDVFPNAGPKGQGLSWIGWGEVETMPEWIKTSAFPLADIRHTAREGIMQMYMVENGIGITQLPCYAQHYSPELQLMPGTTLHPDRSIWLLLHSDLKDTVRVRLLVDFIADELKKLRPLFEGTPTPAP